MKLEYAGQPLLLDHNSQVQDWLEKYLSLDGMMQQTQPAWKASSRESSFGPSNIPLCTPNWAPLPPVTINQLYWPTGASRWAFGYFLVDHDGLLKIRNTVVSSKQISTGKLVIEEGGVKLELDMHMLPPRAVFGGSKPLWLTTLVDKRWEWQYRNMGTIATATDTWSELIDDIATSLGVTIVYTAPSSEWQKPDTFELLNRDFYNPAQLLDAVALSTGTVFVARHDNTYHLLSWSSSETDYSTNRSDLSTVIAGKAVDRRQPVPEKVEVLFPRSKDYSPERFPLYETKTKNASSYSAVDDEATISGTKKTVMSTVWASYTGGTIQNDTVLDDLADKIAESFYESRRKSYDRTFAGLKEWKVVGYDDHILYDLGTGHRGSKTVQTRVQSHPWNWFPDTVNQLDNSILLGEIFAGKTDGSGLTARSGTTPGSGNVGIYALGSGTTLAQVTDSDASNITVKAYNVSTAAVAANSYVILGRDWEGIYWVIVEECQ